MHTLVFPAPRRALLAILLLLLALISAPGIARAQGGITLEQGHADAFDVRFEDSQLRLFFKDDTTGGAPVVRNPGDVVMVARPASQVPGGVPAAGQFAFLGAVGAPLWVLPQVQQSGLLWPGLSTESLTGTWANSQVSITLVSVSGPGNVFLYQTDAFGGVTQLFSSTNAAYRSITVGAPPAAGVHMHMNWAFTATGTYRLTVQATGTHTDLGPLTSAPATYTIVVQGAAPTPTPTPTATPPPATPTPIPATPIPSATIPGGQSPVPSPTASPSSSPSPAPSTTPPGTATSATATATASATPSTTATAPTPPTRTATPDPAPPSATIEPTHTVTAPAAPFPPNTGDGTAGGAPPLAIVLGGGTLALTVGSVALLLRARSRH